MVMRWLVRGTPIWMIGSTNNDIGYAILSLSMQRTPFEELKDINRVLVSRHLDRLVTEKCIHLYFNSLIDR